jgi:transcriptional regulator with XRE-family HTH domain
VPDERVKRGRRLIAALVLAAQLRHKWSQTKSADVCEMSENTYREILRNQGDHDPTAQLKKLSDGLGLDLDLLARLAVGEFSDTGDEVLDRHVERLRRLSADRQTLIIQLVGMLVPS